MLRIAFHLAAATVLLSSLALAAAAPAPSPARATANGRVVVIGFDGASGQKIEELLAATPASEYPTFRRLAAEGTFARLSVEAPPESPVSWAALNTGQNPAKTGVPGFVKRELAPGPIPALGHLGSEKRAIESFDDVPIPTWSPKVMAAVAGGVLFVVTLVLGLLVLRGRFVPALLGALVLGGAGAWAGMTVRGYLPDSVPRSTNPNQARNFWDYAADAGKRVVVLDAAQAFDMPTPDGASVLAGLGVPDARGGIGEWCIYSSDPNEVDRPPKGRDTGTAGTLFRVDPEPGTGAIRSRLYGPANFWLQERVERRLAQIKSELRSPALSMEKSMKLSEEQESLKQEADRIKREPTSVELEVVPAGEGTARVRLGDQTQELAEGEWSDFYELTFELNPLLKVHAITRVHLRYLSEPHFEMFVNVLDVDPRQPPFWQPLSAPFGFSADLAGACGLYETYGWATATMPFKDKEIDAVTMMQDVQFTLEWQERLAYEVLGRDDWDCMMAVFSVTDRVQHMMYQFYDEGHPLYDAEQADRTMEFFGRTIRLGDAIPAIYREMDRVLGNVLERMPDDDTLLVCSDHGFQTFRRQIHLNNWLLENGFLSMKPGATKRDATALAFVDWSQTRVYSLGMGFLYFNLAGREPQGIVQPDDVEALTAELRTRLLDATDPENGKPFCKEVYVTADVHSGPYLAMEGDLLTGFSPEYRISWSSTFGSLSMVKNDVGIDVPGPVVVDNDSPWSGDHVSVALPDVAGVFLSNRRVDLPEGGPRLLQIAPTVLDLLGVPVPPEMDLGPLAVR